MTPAVPKTRNADLVAQIDESARPRECRSFVLLGAFVPCVDVETDQENSQEPAELGVEMLPIALANLRAELSEARELARELARLTPEQADSSWCEQLEEEYRDAGVSQATMARQVAQWRRDHPAAPGLDELAELVADVEPVRQALLQQLARLRCARRSSETDALPGSQE